MREVCRKRLLPGVLTQRSPTMAGMRLSSLTWPSPSMWMRHLRCSQPIVLGTSNRLIPGMRHAVTLRKLLPNRCHCRVRRVQQLG